MTIKIIRRKVSDSARTIARSLNTKMNKLSVWEPRIFRRDKILINWGNSRDFNSGNSIVFNAPEAVRRAVNKRTTLTILQAAGIPVPPFATTLPENRASGDIWIARTKLDGHSGRGIVILRAGDAPVDAPLYTKYIKKHVELRLHIIGNQVVKVAERKKRRNFEHTADQLLIRSYNNGWVHAVENVTECSDEVKAIGIRAIEALGLTFGAIDLVLERGTMNPYILEVNTAPGLTAPSVIAAYKAGFERLAASVLGLENARS